MILITKGGLSRGGDNEMPENCLYDCRLRDTCIYVPRWADEETLLRIGTERSKSCPLVQVYEVPKETGQAHTVMYDRKTEPTISKMEQVEEPQTERGDFADRLAYERGVKHAWEVAQKVFNSTVTFYEAENVAKQIDKDINVRSKNEPQTDTEIAKTIVHKMIDDAVIAEDAYPDLRQKMHDAVDEYEPQTERSE